MQSESWEIRPISGDIVELVNVSGTTAIDVEVSAQGAVVIEGTKGWKALRPEVLEEASICFRYKRAWGAVDVPPRVAVTFHTLQDGSVTRRHITLPL